MCRCRSIICRSLGNISNVCCTQMLRNQIPLFFSSQFLLNLYLQSMFYNISSINLTTLHLKKKLKLWPIFMVSINNFILFEGKTNCWIQIAREDMFLAQHNPTALTTTTGTVPQYSKLRTSFLRSKRSIFIQKDWQFYSKFNNFSFMFCIKT